MQKKTAKTNNLAKNKLKMYIFGYIKAIFYAQLQNIVYFSNL